MRQGGFIFLVLAMFLCPSVLGWAPERRAKFGYQKNKGLVFETRNGNTALWLGLRLQFRYTNLPGDPAEPGELSSQVADEFSLNRGRIKGGGHLFRPWLDIYSEYDFSKNTLLDYRVTLKIHPAARFRAGQWKTEYNRERVDSSGKQQFVDRSIANYWFTLDRQLAAALQGRAGAGRSWDSSYWLTAISGEGRGGGWSDGNPLGVVRYQWNLLGLEVPFSQSDIKRRKDPVAAVSVGGVYGRTRYTRYSSSGGGQLPGYEGGEQDQYDLRQLMQDSIYHGHGFSWQQELHWKRIEDRANGGRRDLWGGYAQAGYFIHEAWDRFPSPIETSARYGLVDPDTGGEDDLQQEYTLGTNWFINGHRDKVTVAASYLTLDDPAGRASEWRVRVQWDVSF